MSIRNEKCDNHCKKTNCFCGLQLNLLHHIKLQCCNSICHVICISSQSFCPYCQHQFNKDDLNYIQRANVKIFEKEKMTEARIRKQVSLRKHIKEVVNQVIQYRMKFK